MTTPNLDMPGADAPVDQLVAALVDFDAVPASLATYLPIRSALQAPTPRPAAPQSLLALDPAAVVGHAADVARWRVLNEPGDRHGPMLENELWLLLRPLDDEAQAALRDAGSEIVAKLRAPFDAAAETMRAAVAKGITPDDDERTLLRASAPVKAAWSACLDAATQLDKLLTIRQALSITAGVAPARAQWSPAMQASFDRGRGSGFPWGIVVTRSGGLGAQDPRALFARWLAVADDLYLADPDQLDDFTVLAASDPALAASLAAAAH